MCAETQRVSCAQFVYGCLLLGMSVCAGLNMWPLYVFVCLCFSCLCVLLVQFCFFEFAPGGVVADRCSFWMGKDLDNLPNICSTVLAVPLIVGVSCFTVVCLCAMQLCPCSHT